MAHGRLIRALVLGLIVVFSLEAVSVPAMAQASPNPSGGESTRPALGGPRKQLATILFAGLGGAILGLSTLSFYGRPQDKLSNIAIGFAVGVIAGTGYVTYKAATNPQELYGTKPQIEIEQENVRGLRFQAKTETPRGLGFTFEF